MTVEEIRAALRAAADPDKAPQMQRYMKSTMPYLGVPVPEVRRIVRPFRTDDVDVLIADAGALWRDARFREERYAATALCAVSRIRDLALLPLYREMIVTGAWWDHVDEVSHRIGELLTAFPADLRPVLLDWAVADDLWLRRSAIISQLGAKADTDLALLAAVLTPNLADRRFFVAKAIGWALRQYAYVDPDWVRRYSDTHDLTPLSRREALKHL